MGDVERTIPRPLAGASSARVPARPSGRWSPCPLARRAATGSASRPRRTSASAARRGPAGPPRPGPQPVPWRQRPGLHEEASRIKWPRATLPRARTRRSSDSLWTAPRAPDAPSRGGHPRCASWSKPSHARRGDASAQVPAAARRVSVQAHDRQPLSRRSVLRCSRSFHATSASPRTKARKSQRVMTRQCRSVVAVTVAVRVRSVRRATSPK